MSGGITRAERVGRELGALFTRGATPAVAVDGAGWIVAANEAARSKLPGILAMRLTELRWVRPSTLQVEIEGEALTVCVDATEERARLFAAERLATIGRLAGGVAHEVNNPAAFVTLALQAVRDKTAGDARAMIDEAFGAMMHINAIMRDLTRFSRERAKADIDLGLLATSVLRLASHQIEGEVTRVFEEGVIAEVRSARVAQVLLAALLAAPGGGVEVRVARSGEWAVLEVTGDTVDELWKSIVEEEGGTLDLSGGRVRMCLPAMRSETSEARQASP